MVIMFFFSVLLELYPWHLTSVVLYLFSKTVLPLYVFHQNFLIFLKIIILRESVIFLVNFLNVI